MNILYLITGLGLGGAEKVVANLADQMYLKGHNVKIAYLKGKVSVSPKHSNIELVYLGLEKPTNILSAIKNYRTLIKSYRPDVVHAHMVHANIFSRISRLFCNIPKLICTAHNTNEGGKLRMLAYKYTNCLSDLNTNVSQEASLSLINKGAFTHENLKTVYNGIDLELFSKKEQSDNNLDYIQFLSVGRLNAQKDYFNLLNAIKIVSKQHENVHFNIVGDGELYSLIEKSIIDLKISKFVSLLGARSDISQLMHKSDFFVLSSSHEGLPTVLIEAQASQLFVIATDCGGSREIMGETGIIVPPKNSKALADGILKAIKIPSPIIKENNKKALEYTYKKFDLNKVVNEWDNIYSQKKIL